MSLSPNALSLSNDLIEFLDASPTAFHAGSSIMACLMDAGFTRLDEAQTWDLEPGCGYFMEHGNSAVAAFRMGHKTVARSGFHIVGAHTDSPSLKLKTDSEQVTAGCAKVNVEVYGGPILNTWLDRDLALAGKVMVKGASGWEAQLIDIRRPLALIPNLAIHLNREVNKGVELNPQTQLPAIFGPVNSDCTSFLKELIALDLDVDVTELGEMDLYLYDHQGATRGGLRGETISSARIDNLAMCHAITTALCNSDESEVTSVGVFFDHEEVGSQTTQGADSSFLRNVLERINCVQGGDAQDYFRAIARSFMISADGAHAIHPNYAAQHDSDYAPQMNQGPVIKFSANMRYATTAESANRFIELCNQVGVTYQKVVNRSDIPSGSTIGPICAAVLGIRSIDVGNAMWAMHSIRETAGVQDHYDMTRVLQAFYEA
jgi:aspartyl aminopeptidase